ncbi:hypothetical protein ACN2XU_20700 [Primorskyibacter sp. 2E107]|uniref:hypothetical protein n=1 Tax=Primorskyibacter sp. 2E107 TaxID=3403458 RepID=UPI003AF6AAC8
MRHAKLFLIGFAVAIATILGAPVIATDYWILGLLVPGSYLAMHLWARRARALTTQARPWTLVEDLAAPVVSREGRRRLYGIGIGLPVGFFILNEWMAPWT